jgi:hypothetical protein
LAAVRTANQSRSIRAVGGASIALVAVCLVAGFWAVQKLLPPPPVASAAKQEGTVYGAENTGSRFTLRIHRPTIVLISGRTGQFLVERAMQAGDSYRAPNLPDLTVTTQDAGAVEVVFDEKSLGYIGKNGTSVQRVSLRRFVPALQVKTAKETAGRTTKPSTTVETARAVPTKPETAKQAESVNKAEQPTAAANVSDRTAVSAAAPSRTPPIRDTADQAVATKQAAAPPTGLPQGTNQPVAAPSIFEQVIEAETKAAASSTPQSMRAKPVILKQDPAQAARDAAARAKALKELDEGKAIERERQRRAFSNSLKGLSSPF